MQDISSIAKELKLTKREVKESLESGLCKIWEKMKILFPTSTPFERMEFLGRMLGVETDEEWPEFFYGFPVQIKKEVLESIKESEAVFKHIDTSKFLNRADK